MAMMEIDHPKALVFGRIAGYIYYKQN